MGRKVLVLAHDLVGYEISQFLMSSESGVKRQELLFVTQTENDISSLAKERGVQVLFWPHFIAAFEESALPAVELGVLAWWPKIISRELINFALNGFVNLHPSLLPYGRGKHPNFWAIANQEPFGVSIHYATEALDGGPIIAQRPIGVDWTDSGETLYKKAQSSIVILFKETWPKLRTQRVAAFTQQESLGSFHMSKDMEMACRLELDETCSVRHLINLLRARTFAGQPACYFVDDGSTYELRLSITKV